MKNEAIIHKKMHEMRQKILKRSKNLKKDPKITKRDARMKQKLRKKCIQKNDAKIFQFMQISYK